MFESEFINSLKEIFGEGSGYNELEITLSNYDHANGKLVIELKQMYRFVDVQFDQLAKLAELAQTRKINIGNKTSRGGCSTCDWGSSYKVPIHLDNFFIPLDKDTPKSRNT